MVGDGEKAFIYLFFIKVESNRIVIKINVVGGMVMQANFSSYGNGSSGKRLKL